MFLTINGGVWLIPLLICLAILGYAEYITRNNLKINKILNITAYAVLFVLLILYIMFYFDTPVEIPVAVYLTPIVLFQIVIAVFRHYKKRFGTNYRYIYTALKIIYMLLAVIMILIESRFTIVGWTSSVFVVSILAIQDYMNDKFPKQEK